MNFDLSVITANAIVIVPIIIAVCEAIKLTGWIKSHFMPLVSIGIGIIIGFLADHANEDLTVTILSGAVYGLIASGLYSGIKTTMKANMKAKEKRERNQAKSKGNNTGNC